MITEAIILAGGLGTRLRSAVPELPKCMAPVNGRPFIAYVVDHLRQQGITDFIFALGYKSDAFNSFLDTLHETRYRLSIENEPMGTGGAIKLACQLVKGKNVIVTNGDTLFKADIPALGTFHQNHHAHCTLCLKPMQRFDRYGVVEINDRQSVTAFKEKSYYEKGLINGGLYALDKESFLGEATADKFSFETGYLETSVARGKLFGLVQDAYFIDIGIPEDYNRAQEELR